MPIEIVRNDITRMRVDAIVNAANESLLGGAGVDGAIHHAAGPALLAECRTLGGCKTGSAKATGAYGLSAKYVIHTVGPIWQGGSQGEQELLRACYMNSLALAREKGCESVAFPLISSGAYGYPKAQAFRVAMDAIRDFLAEDDADMLVYMVLFDGSSFAAGSKLYAGVAQYIDDHYVEAHVDADMEQSRSRMLHFAQKAAHAAERPCYAIADETAEEKAEAKPHGKQKPLNAFQGKEKAAGMAASVCPGAGGLEDALKRMEETFSQMLLRSIDEKGITDAACYKRANIDRKLFSKIRSDTNYKPSKRTALALAIALELPLEDTERLLKKAGLALSHSNKFDVIVEYHIVHGIYDIYAINEALFYFDQPLLGA